MAARTFGFEVTRTSSAPAATLFRIVSDGGRWSEWAEPLQSDWERLGDPPPDGVGAIRRVGLWRLRVREATIDYERDHRHVYTVLGPSPAKNYRGEVILTPNASGGTDLRWSGSFEEAIPLTGPAVLMVFRRAVTRFARQLVSYAERDTGVGESG